MEKKILTVSALCFLMIGLTAVLGILIEDEMMRRIMVIAGCLIVVWLTTLNFRYLKLMKQQLAGALTEVPTLVHWLQGETWPEILSLEKVKDRFGAELTAFLERYPSCDVESVKGYRIWRSDETELFFEEAGQAARQILVLMDVDGQHFQVFGSTALQQAMEARAKKS